MSKVQFKPVTVRQAESEADSRLFVLNLARPQANISLNITSSNGERNVISLPISPCPVDLSHFCEKVDVLKSPVFRRLVASGYVAIIETEQASEFVENDPRGIRETKRIFKANHDGPEFDTTAVIESTFAGSGAPTPTLAEQVGAGSSNMFIESIVLRSKTEDAADLISELDSRIDTLQINDIEYLSNHAASPAIKEWAVEARSIFE